LFVCWAPYFSPAFLCPDLLVLRSRSLGGHYQRWTWTKDAKLTGGYVVNDKPGKALRTNVCQAGNAFQQWDYRTQGPHGSVTTLRNRGSQLCLSASNADLTVAEPLVVLEPCSQACKQLWTLTGNKTALERMRPSHPKQGQSTDHLPRHDLSYLRLPAPLPEYAPGATDVSKPARAGKLACWIMTSPGNHAEKAVVINNTWGQGCDILLFMTTQHQAWLNAVRLWQSCLMGDGVSRTMGWHCFVACFACHRLSNHAVFHHHLSLRVMSCHRSC